MKKVLILEADETTGLEMRPADHIDKDLVDRCDVVMGFDEEGDLQFIKHPGFKPGEVMSRSFSGYVKSIIAEKAEDPPPEPLELTDTDPMPFGKHQGKPMGQVPASYFRWCWNKFAKEKAPGENKVADYIRKNKAALEQEDADGIWD